MDAQMAESFLHQHHDWHPHADSLVAEAINKHTSKASITSSHGTLSTKTR